LSNPGYKIKITPNKVIKKKYYEIQYLLNSTLKDAIAKKYEDQIVKSQSISLFIATVKC
jgi:hypothetical protein